MTGNVFKTSFGRMAVNTPLGIILSVETYGGHVCAPGPSDPYFGGFTCLMGGLANPQLLGYLTYYFTYPIT